MRISDKRTRLFIYIFCLVSKRTSIVSIFLISGSQGQLYVGPGGTCPQIHLLPPQIQKLANRSDVIAEVRKCSKIHFFSVLHPGPRSPRWGSLQRSPDPLADEEGVRCPISRTPLLLSALRASFLRVSESNPIQNWQPY